MMVLWLQYLIAGTTPCVCASPYAHAWNYLLLPSPFWVCLTLQRSILVLGVEIHCSWFKLLYSWLTNHGRATLPLRRRTREEAAWIWRCGRRGGWRPEELHRPIYPQRRAKERNGGGIPSTSWGSRGLRGNQASGTKDRGRKSEFCSIVCIYFGARFTFVQFRCNFLLLFATVPFTIVHCKKDGLCLQVAPSTQLILFNWQATEIARHIKLLCNSWLRLIKVD